MYEYREQNGSYFFFKDNSPLLTPMDNQVCTLYEPLANRILKDLETFGEDPSDPLSMVSFHYPMIDFYASLPREELEDSIRIGLSKENDWTFNCPTAEPHAMMRWLTFFGKYSDVALKGEAWLAGLTPMQLCAVCVIGRALESVNIPYILGSRDLGEAAKKIFLEEVDKCYPYVGAGDLGIYFNNFLFYFHMGRDNPTNSRISKEWQEDQSDDVEDSDAIETSLFEVYVDCPFCGTNIVTAYDFESAYDVLSEDQIEAVTCSGDYFDEISSPCEHVAFFSDGECEYYSDPKWEKEVIALASVITKNDSLLTDENINLNEAIDEIAEELDDGDVGEVVAGRASFVYEITKTYVEKFNGVKCGGPTYTSIFLSSLEDAS